MPLDARVYRVLIASPSDVPAERAAVANAIQQWNRAHGAILGIIFLPLMWEEDVAPAMGIRPQGHVNRSIVDDADLLIGIFWTRLGTRTEQEESGTVEEINRIQARCGGENVLLYFSTANVNPYDFDPEEFDRLNRFKALCAKNGIYHNFGSIEELVDLVTRHLTMRARDFAQDRVNNATADTTDANSIANRAIREMVAAAQLAAQVQAREVQESRRATLAIEARDGKAGPWMATIREPTKAGIWFRVLNDGRADARDVRAKVTIGQNQPLILQGPRVLPPHEVAEFKFDLPLFVSFPGPPGGPVPEDYPDSELIRIHLLYRDDQSELGEQKTKDWCFRFSRVQEGAKWVAHELDACPSPPQNLTAEEHRILESLVRRAATRPNVFTPQILVHRPGDDKIMYQSELISSAIPNQEDRKPFYPDRDFLPNLVREGYVVKSSHHMYDMTRLLFESYGYRAPFL